MQTTFKQIAFVAVSASFLVACNSKSESVADYEANSDIISTAVAAADSIAHRQFIRTADAKFSVKDVYVATQKIESIVYQNGGFLTLSDLQSYETDHQQVEISTDSLLEIKHFRVENEIAFRVPTKRLDSTLRQIGRLIDYLDHRTIRADEVTFDLQAATMNGESLQNHGERLRKAIDQKGQKLKDITQAEEVFINRENEANDAQINSRRLKDDVAYSTVKVLLYQLPISSKTLIANTFFVQKSPFGYRMSQALSGGWDLLQNIVLFVANGWSVWLILIAGWVFWQKTRIKKAF